MKIDEIDEKKFDEAASQGPLEGTQKDPLGPLSEEEFNKLLVEMQNPVEAQKR